MKLTIFADGGSRGNPGPAACGVVILANGQKLAEFGQKIGITTNNFAEYKALELAFEKAVTICQKQKFEKIEVFMDSQLVIKQLTGQFKIKEPKLAGILANILRLEKFLPPVKYNLVERSKNWQADRLVNLALNAKTVNRKQ